MLEVKNIKKSFGDKEVLKELSFEVPDGAVFGFIGPNGAGKTTTMKMVLGMIRPDAGTILVNGRRVVYGQNETNRFIGYLPDVPEFYNYMTPAEYLDLCGQVEGMGKKERRRRAEDLLSLVGLSGERKRIGGFSRGMKQRLGIAQALFHDPALLILDEPTSALDPVGRKEILDLLMEVRHHATIVFSTHILADVERICDRIAVLERGRVAMQGTMEEIKASHQKDSMEVEFVSEAEKRAFLESAKVRDMEADGMVRIEQGAHADTLLLHTKDREALQEKLYQIFLLTRSYPRKIAQSEPTLESLFMEVVKA